LQSDETHDVPEGLTSPVHYITMYRN
jgi:hypothetical protein